MSNAPITLVIPDDVRFEDLQLARDPQNGDITFDWTPVERICAASGLDLARLEDPACDDLSELIVAWYEAHLAAGGAPDEVQEALLAEEDGRTED